MTKNLLDILLLLLAVILPMSLGYLTRLTKLFTPNESDTLGKFVIRIAVPFLIFKSLYNANLTSLAQIFPSIIAFFLLTVLFSICGYYLARLVATESLHQNAIALTVFAGNYIFLGWGVIDSFYSPEALTRAVFFTLLAWPVFLVCGFSLIHFANRNQPGTATASHSFFKLMVKNAGIHFIAAILAIALNLLHVPIAIVLTDFVHKFAAVTVPTILFTIGLNFKLVMPRNQIKMILSASLLRLLLGGGIGLLALLAVKSLFPIDLLTEKVILFLATMPAAAMTVFFSQYIRMDKELQAGIITFSTLLSFITIPTWYLLIEKFW